MAGFSFRGPGPEDVNELTKEDLAETGEEFVRGAERCDRSSILAYFSVAVHHLQVPDTVSRSMRRKLNGIFYNEMVPCHLIGQLARSGSCPREDLGGHELLGYALNVLANVHELVGGRFVLVERKEHEALLSFYQRNGFTSLPEKKGAYCRLVKFMRAEKEVGSGLGPERISAAPP